MVSTIQAPAEQRECIHAGRGSGGISHDGTLWRFPDAVGLPLIDDAVDTDAAGTDLQRAKLGFGSRPYFWNAGCSTLVIKERPTKNLDSLSAFDRCFVGLSGCPLSKGSHYGRNNQKFHVCPQIKKLYVDVLYKFCIFLNVFKA